MLSAVDVEKLSGHDRTVVMRAEARMAAHYQARSYRAMAAVAEAYENADPEFGVEGASAEISCALHLTRRAADSELGFALELLERVPQVLHALKAGSIDTRRARVIISGTSHLDAETARAVVDQIIDEAVHLTTGQLRARLRRLCLESDPEEAKKRYEEATADRRLVSEATDSGTDNLMGMDLAPHLVQQATDRINRFAQKLKTAGETRTMDQLRADVFLDLLLGKQHEQSGNAGGVVHITTSLETLVELAEEPGELAGYGPVVADITRQIAKESERAEWWWTITNPNGTPVHTQTTRRRPTKQLDRLVKAANPTCVFPGCRMPSINCDVDHRLEWSRGGPTCNCNLGPVCRYHHVIRPQHNWTYQPDRYGYTWTSPLGHKYHKRVQLARAP